MPSARTACFRAIANALWRGIRGDSVRTGLYAFFPLAAYERVKAIADPRGDYAGRLLPDFRLDVHAAHELLGSRAGTARLIGVIVPKGYVRWVPPGACYNASATTRCRTRGSSTAPAAGSARSGSHR